jgi:hypothetical protein
MATKKIMEDARQALAECLRELIEEKYFAPPLQVAIIGANGNACILSYEVSSDGLDASFRFADNGELGLPLNMMIVDSRAEAARLLISLRGERKLLH